MEIQNSKSHTHVRQLNIVRDISVKVVPPEEQGVPAPQQPPQPMLPCREKKFPQLLAVKTSRDWG